MYSHFKNIVPRKHVLNLAFVPSLSEITPFTMYGAAHRKHLGPVSPGSNIIILSGQILGPTGGIMGRTNRKEKNNQNAKVRGT